MNRNKKVKLFRPRIIIITGVLISVVMLVVAALEISRTKNRITQLTFEKGLALASQIEQGTALSIRAVDTIEEELSTRLLSAANTAAALDAQGGLTHKTIGEIAANHYILTMHAVWADGEIQVTNKPRKRNRTSSDFTRLFPDLFSGKSDHMVLGLHIPPHRKVERFSVGVARKGGGIIIASVDGRELAQLRRSFGYGRLIQDVGKTRDVVHAVLQDPSGIIAASKGFATAQSIDSDPFLTKAWGTRKPMHRMIKADGEKLFEVVTVISADPESPALLRIAFDGTELQRLQNKAVRRLIITFIALTAILAAAINGFIVFQNFDLVKRARDEVATFSDTILNSMGDGVLILRSDGTVRMKNEVLEKLFRIGENNPPPALLEIADETFAKGKPAIKRITWQDPEKKDDLRQLLVSSSRIYVKGQDIPYVVLICRDETELRRMEQEVRRNERIVEMGKLAGAVAHEVRNPLNAIGMTMQRLESEFEPTSGVSEYGSLLEIVSSEIKRLDNIIGQFLQFARSPVVEKTEGDLAGLAASVISEIKAAAVAKGTDLQYADPQKLPAKFDEKQIRRLLLNLLTNSLDACGPGDKVTLKLVDGARILISVADTGTGMSPDELSRAFDLYYTGKDQGTGLGLPIALQIVKAHFGTLDIKSEQGKGTTATITIPRGRVS